MLRRICPHYAKTRGAAASRAAPVQRWLSRAFVGQLLTLDGQCGTLEAWSVTALLAVMFRLALRAASQGHCHKVSWNWVTLTGSGTPHYTALGHIFARLPEDSTQSRLVRVQIVAGLTRSCLNCWATRKPPLPSMHLSIRAAASSGAAYINLGTAKHGISDCFLPNCYFGIIRVNNSRCADFL